MAVADPAPYSNPGMSNLLTPDQIARNRKLGETLMMQGMSTEPVGHWTQGLARVLQAGVGRSHMTSADEAQQARQQAMMGALQSSPTFAGLSPGDRAMMGMDPDMMRSILPHVFAQKLDPMAGLRRQLAEEDLRFKREHNPTALERERQQLADMREESGFKSQMRPIQLESERKKLESDPLMIVPDGATVLNRQTREVTQPAGQSWNKLPEFAAKSAAFASRMVEAERNMRTILAEVEARRSRQEKGFDPTTAGTAAVNALPEMAANFVRNPDHQKYRQAAEQWIRAFLRKESGAAISKDEFARDFIVYFPQPGDKPDVIKQKEQARLEAMKGFVEETRNYFGHVNPRGQQQINEWYKAVSPPPAERVNSGPGIPVAPQQATPPSPQPAPLPKQLKVYPRPPQAAVDELMRDKSQAAIDEFIETFGEEAAKAALKGRR